MRISIQEGDPLKARVTNHMSAYYLSIIDIKSINYKYVFGVGCGVDGKVKVPYEDVEFICDNELEKCIVKYRDVLKISLPHGVSPGFYGMLSNSIEEHIKGNIRSISILFDSNEKARKKHWYKRIVAVVNDTCPLLISASGRDFTNCCNINIEDINVDEFVDECRKEMQRIKDIIDTGVNKMISYEKMLYKLKNTERCMIGKEL